MESLLAGSGMDANTKVTAVSQAAKIHSVIYSTTFDFTNVFIKAFGVYGIGRRKLKKNDTIDRWPLLSGQHPTSFPGKSALGTRLNNIVCVNIACVAGAWKYLGVEKNRRAKVRHARVERNTCLPRARRSLFSPLFPSACYAGYIEQQ